MTLHGIRILIFVVNNKFTGKSSVVTSKRLQIGNKFSGSENSDVDLDTSTTLKPSKNQSLLEESVIDQALDGDKEEFFRQHQRDHESDLD